jgi:RNA polymerase sigma-70 factor (ECF subfamily)
MEHELRRQAVERAYRDHADDVYRVAYAILRDPDAAADATHDSFARAFERWEQYDANRPLRAWLHGIVTHAALDAVRRRKVRGPGLGPGHLEGNGGVREIVVVDPTGGADPALRVVHRRLVDEALAMLKPDARAALVLRHYHGYDYAEIATFLGTTPGNVGSIISRAHATLRTRMTADAPTTALTPDVDAHRRVVR